MKPRYLLIPVFLLALSFNSFSQDLTDVFGNETTGKIPVTATFKGLKVINAQSNETLKKKSLMFNIAHRFGDMGGYAGGAHTLYGFDASTDIRFSFDYGVTNNFQIGIGRAKGIEPMQEFYDLNLKYKLLQQTTDNKTPFSVTLFGMGGATTRVASSDPTSPAYFGSTSAFAHRLSYTSQIILSYKYNSKFSIAVIPSYNHRNLVDYLDKNDLLSVGSAIRFKFTKRFALVADYFYNFSDYRNTTTNSAGDKVFYNPLGLGLELETGGHVFTVNFTNSTGITENEFLPYTESNWLKGQFRLGFNISRNFAL